MNTDLIQLIVNIGLPAVLLIGIARYVAKHTPTILAEWSKFVVANERYSTSIDRNTEVTAKGNEIIEKHYQENLTVQDLLRKAIDKLDEHHENAEDINQKVDYVKTDIAELKDLFIELAQRIEGLEGK